MAVTYAFSKEEMGIDAGLGYPKAYAKLCKDTSLSPYTRGPPFTLTPYTLHTHEASRAEELDDIFPIIDIEAKPTAKTRIFVSILWKQLNHLGNAGLDPAMFRVDPYGNVLYFHADSSSPLAWTIDHWFPCSRGGLTVPSNLRILQWQVCKRKHNQLEYLVPWWDLQLGISVNQFLSIFASANSDFRKRAFRLLFQAGEHEELNDLQTVDSHSFPQPFIESIDQLGLAPAAVVLSRKQSTDPSSSTLRSLDINRQSRPSTPVVAAAKKFRNGQLKENEMPDMITNPYQAIVMARDSLKQREENNKMKNEVHRLDGQLKENEMPDMITNPYQAIVMARDSLKQREENNKMKNEVHRLDDEVNEFRLKNEEEMVTIQELEMELMKCRRRAEKCRKLAEAQSAHRAVLEKMISNAMHQSVVYKEQVRLNQAATNSLMARLEAHIAISNSAERELHRKFKQQDELEKLIAQEPEQARKRSRIENNTDALVVHLPILKSERHLHKKLREFLEEEQKLSEAALALIEEEKTEGIRKVPLKLTLEPHTGEGNDEPDNVKRPSIRYPFAQDREVEEDEESRKKKGKGNVDKWLQMLLEDTDQEEGSSPHKSAEESGTNKSDEIVKTLNERYPQKEIEDVEMEANQICEENFGKCKEFSGKEGVAFNTDLGKKKGNLELEPKRSRSMSTRRRSISSEADNIGKADKGVARCESARLLRLFPSSPAMILNMRKGRDENQTAGHNLLQSSMKTIKKVVKI